MLHVQATVRATGRVAQAQLGGLNQGEVEVLTLGVWNELPSFTLRLEATAADGSQATTCARFDAHLDHYV